MLRVPDLESGLDPRSLRSAPPIFGVRSSVLGGLYSINTHSQDSDEDSDRIEVGK